MSTRFRTIVADPPWEYREGTGVASRYPDGPGGPPVLDYSQPKGKLPYQSMTIHQIMALPVASLAANDAHLFLWTTNRYLHDAYHILHVWQFEPCKPLVWCKPPKAPFMGGPFGGSSVEFCLYARREGARSTGRVGRQWWEWPRAAHSAKPEAFLDLVEATCPGPYAELFARRARFGWDYPIGDQALGGEAA